jgi:hypothetical protein
LNCLRSDAVVRNVHYAYPGTARSVSPGNVPGAFAVPEQEVRGAQVPRP